MLQQLKVNPKIYCIRINFQQPMNGEDVDQNFVCLICTELANNAVETLCCGQIMCEACSNDLIIKNHLNCPNCRQKLVVKQSIIARRLISTIKLACDQCNDKFAHKQLQSHKRKCAKRIINCKDCLKEIRISHMIEHMKQEHSQKLLDLCLEYQLGPQQLPTMSKVQSCVTEMVSSKIRTGKGKNCQLGTTNKYYCGERALIGKCGCCDGRCGPTNGQNCDDCMEADVKRFNLAKGYLVNTAGVVCKLDPGTKQFYCGRMTHSKNFCAKGSCCSDCQRVTNSIKLGRYKNLL